MSAAGEAKPSRGPKAAAQRDCREADALAFAVEDDAMRPRA